MSKYSTQLAVYILTIMMMCSTVVAVDVEFYSLNSAHNDSSKIKMTEDLFYTQLLSLPEYRVVDKRPSIYSGSTDNPNQDTMIFHGELQEQDNTWTCTLTLEQPHLNKKAQVTSNYDSYFKILSDAKSSISQLFANISNSSSGMASSRTAPQGAVGLRGGRGFVIFNNGASMNITVEIKGSTIICTQSGKSNASFFPELPREVALVAAMDAQPITWTMTLSSNSTLTGTKQSLQAIMVAGSAVGAEMGTSQVTWTRQ